MNECVLVTGGAGFIGSNFVREWIQAEDAPIVNLDKLTYAGNLQNLDGLGSDDRHTFVQGDINDRGLVRQLFARYKPRIIVHFAAESHVDRSILGPEEFLRTNVHGTFSLLEEARAYWNNLSSGERGRFVFLHVSTDEVYGSLCMDDPAFSERTPYAPNSPYAASKAASDHLVRAYFHTYGLPTITTNCSNNYGPYQFPEKLIPLMILNALSGQPLPVYGDGQNVRDWLYVADHCEAIRTAMHKGRPGETYNVGGSSEKKNIEVVTTLCTLLDEFCPRATGSYRELITFVNDRPGHDWRYAIDATKIRRELGWEPRHKFDEAMRKTVQWYLEHMDWVENIRSGAYQQWIETNYAKRGAACGA